MVNKVLVDEANVVLQIRIIAFEMILGSEEVVGASLHVRDNNKNRISLWVSKSVEDDLRLRVSLTPNYV